MCRARRWSEQCPVAAGRMVLLVMVLLVMVLPVIVLLVITAGRR